MISSPRLRLVRPRLTTIVLAAALLVAASYAASWIAQAPGVPAARPGGDAPAPSLAPAQQLAAGPSEALLTRFERAIAAWIGNVATNPGDYVSATNLGTVYVGRARLTGNVADYQRALVAADDAIEINAAYTPARGLRATILFALHDFRGALAEARATHELDSSDLQALATIGDASLELGDVEAARVAYAELDRLASSPPVWSRLAHLAFISGEIERATDLAARAVAGVADEPRSEGTAFYSFQLGELHRSRGDLAAAAAAYTQALDDLPGYVPASAGLGRVREAQGRRDEAVELLEGATARLPQPDLVASLGDLYALDGDGAAAERQYALVERIGDVTAATGSVYDRQLVLFAADHDRDLPKAIARARAELAIRHDIYAHDALAWALFKAGQTDEAAAEAEAALALGTQDPRLAYHAGMIAAAQGRTDDARRLLTLAMEGAGYLPPLQVPVLEQAIADLAGGAR